MIFNKTMGLTLIEILITLAIFSFAFIALAAFQKNFIASETLAFDRQEATHLAEKKIEELKGFSDLTGYNQIASGNGSITGAHGVYSMVWTITNTSAPAYKKVNVVVTWNDLANVQQSITLTSHVAGIDPATSGTAVTGFVGGIPEP